MKNDVRKLIKGIIKENTTYARQEVLRERKKIAEELNAKGLLKSSIMIQSIYVAINSIIELSLAESIDNICNLEKELNYKYQANDYREISECLSNSFSKVIESEYNDTTVNDINKKYSIGFDRSQIDIYISGIQGRVNGRINDFREVNTLKAKATKDEIAVKLTKRANLYSLLALIISIIAFGLTYIKE